MNLKKPISAAMAAMMTLSVTATPALAAVEDPPGTSTQVDEPDTDATLGEQSSVEEDALNSSDTSEKSHQDAKVYASANGSYVLTVPESINLHNVEKKDLGSGLYTNDKHCKVNLRGDVRQDQVVVVTVTEPVMQSEGSKDVDATVDTSSKTVWNRDDLFTGATAGEDGSYTEPTGVTTVYPVSAELTPGNWVGTAMFNCSLETVPSIVGAITGLETSNFDYDGNLHSPKLKFSDGTALEEGKDYTISGDTAKTDEGNYTITIKGAGKYVGTLTFSWTIKKQDISDTVVGLDSTAFEEGGTSHAPTITWKEGSNLKAGVDYEVSGTTSASDAGDYTITIAGKGKYKGSLNLTWKITSKPDIALAISGLSSTHFDYDGSEKSPELVFAEGYEGLVRDVDYAVSGTTSAVNSGDYSITVKGIGRCKGTVKFDWDIRELIPVGGTYTVNETKETLIGDGETVYFPQYCNNGDTYVDTDYRYIFNSGGLWHVYVLETDKSFYGAIRSFICNKDVYTMEYTFKNCSQMVRSPDIPDTVRCINYTFQGCTSLVEAPKIPDGVTNMYGTFFGCTTLKTYVGSTDADGDFSNYVIPDKVTDMSRTFYYCTSLTEAPVIPDKVTNMSSTFSGCTSLTEAPVIPDKVTDMSSTFFRCTSLKEAPAIGNSVINMINTFYGCNSLTKAPVIPDSVTNMTCTFSGCASLTEAPVIGNNVTSMEYTFEYCSKLVKAPIIPDSVTSMVGTFYNCRSMVSAPEIPQGVTKITLYSGKIGNYAGIFRECASLKTYAGSRDPDGDFSNFTTESKKPRPFRVGFA